MSGSWAKEGGTPLMDAKLLLLPQLLLLLLPPPPPPPLLADKRPLVSPLMSGSIISVLILIRPGSSSALTSPLPSPPSSFLVTSLLLTRSSSHLEGSVKEDKDGTTSSDSVKGQELVDGSSLSCSTAAAVAVAAADEDDDDV